MLGFSSTSLFSLRKQEAVNQGGTRVMHHQHEGKSQRADNVKDWKEKQNQGYIPHDSYFLMENRKAVKCTTFSSLLVFFVFLSFLFSLPPAVAAFGERQGRQCLPNIFKRKMST